MIRWLLCFVLAGAPVLAQKPTPAAPAADEDDADDTAEQLANVKRVYVDLLTGGAPALRIRDLLITSLQSSKLFIVTENEEKADAVLKGAADDAVFTENFNSSEGINAHTNVSLPSTNTKGTGYSNRTSAQLSIGENENHRSEERKHEAIATVRLVGKEGDVIWSTTQESFGGKFLGASADVAAKVAKRLAADVRKAKEEVAAKPQ